jgi:hypothetical protein
MAISGNICLGAELLNEFGYVDRNPNITVPVIYNKYHNFWEGFKNTDMLSGVLQRCHFIQSLTLVLLF